MSLFARIRHHVALHRDFVPILVLTTAFRLMAVLVVRPGGFIGDISTFGWFRILLSFTNQGFFPHVDFWVEYPPIFPWLLVGIYRLSLLIPTWAEPGTWFYLLLSSILAVVEVGNVVLVYAIGRRLYDQQKAIRLTWMYTALLVPVLTLFMSFDGLGLFFMLLVVLFTLDKRPIAAGIAAGLGFMTKIVPVVAGPASLRHMQRPAQWLRILLAAAVTVAIIAAPFLLTSPEYFVPSFTGPLSRASWETVWALIDGYYSYGVAGGPNRFDPADAGAAQHASQIPGLVLTAGFALLYLALFTRPIDWSDRRRTVAFSALTLHLFLLYSQGYSPQFLIMLMPFLLLLLPGMRGIVYAVLLTLVNLVEYPLYFIVLPDQHWLLTGTVLFRTLILIVVGCEYARQVYGWRVPERVWQGVAIGTLCVGIIAGAFGTVAGVRAFSEQRYQASPYREAMDTLDQEAEAGAIVITSDQWIYEQLYPFLRNRFRVRLVETLDYLPPWQPRMEELAATGDQLWLYARTDSELYDWLSERHSLLSSHDFDGWRLSGWYTP